MVTLRNLHQTGFSTIYFLQLCAAYPPLTVLCSNVKWNDNGSKLKQIPTAAENPLHGQFRCFDDFYL